MRTILLLPAVLLVLLLGVACSDDGGDDAGEDTIATVADDGARGTAAPSGGSFCDAAEAFAVASTGAPDADRPDEVEERVTAMADAVDGLRQYAADRDFAVDLGGAAPESQSGEGADVVAAINGSIAVVDQAVQDECGHFINEVPED